MLKDGLHVAGNQRRLMGIPLSIGVDTKFAKHQRSVARNVLQPVKVGAQLCEIMQVHIEEIKIKPGRLEKLRCWEICERCETIRGNLFYRVRKFFDKLLETLMTMKSNNVVRDLIDDANSHNRRMLCRKMGRGRNLAACRLARRPVFKKTAVLLPGNIQYNLEPMFKGLVERGRRRKGVQANRVGA